MTTAVRAASAVATSSGSTAVSMSAPAGTTTGDLVIVMVHANAAPTCVDNNGSTPFTLIDSHSQAFTGMTVYLFKRKIQAGDPSTYAFTLGSSQRWSAVAVTFSSPNTVADLDVVPSWADSGGALAGSGNAPDITTLHNGSIHCALFATDSSGDTINTTPSGYTVQANGGSNQNLAFCTKTITTAGATGAQGFTYGFDGNISCSLAVLDDSATFGPTISSVNSGTALANDATGFNVTGTGYTGTTTLHFIQGSVDVAQTVTGNTTTTLTATVVFDTGGASLKNAAATARVSDGTNHADLSITITAPTGHAFVDIATPNSNSAYIFSGSPVLDAGDQIEIRNVSTGTVTDVTLYNDGTISWAPGVTGFDARRWDATNATWSSWQAQSTGYSIVAVAGSYAVTGQAATIKRSKLVTAAQGSYSYTGQAATLLRSKVVTAAFGTYGVSGQAATITYTPGSVNYTITATAGAYSVSGQSATLLKSKVVAAAQGSYSIAGQAATLTRNYLVAGAAGSYAYTGQAANIAYTPNSGAYTLAADAGTYSITGFTAQIGYIGQSVGQTPAGSSRTRRTLSIYRVRVDGQTFEFKSYEDAVAFLEQAKKFAIAQAQAHVKAVTEQPQRLPDLPLPDITYNTRQLRAVVSEAQREIEKTYRQAMIDAEIAMLFALDRNAEQDEDSILLLM